VSHQGDEIQVSNASHTGNEIQIGCASPPSFSERNESQLHKRLNLCSSLHTNMDLTEKIDVLDMLIAVLREHEKALDDVVARLEKLAKRD